MSSPAEYLRALETSFERLVDAVAEQRDTTARLIDKLEISDRDPALLTGTIQSLTAARDALSALVTVIGRFPMEELAEDENADTMLTDLGLALSRAQALMDQNASIQRALVRALEQPKSAQLSPSPDPFAARNLAPFASGAPAFGALRAILQAHRWLADEEGRPRYVQEVSGRQLKGTFAYHIILPPNASGEDAALAQKELAYTILRDMGTDTAWLHMLTLAYAAQTDKGQSAVISRQAVYRAMGLDKRTDLTRREKDRRCADEIARLRSLGLSILRLSLAGKNGKNLEYHRRTSSLWHLTVDEYGQAHFEEEGGQWVTHYAEWQLLARPGEWADLFLFGEPMRQIGYMARDMFEKIDRRRAPWGFHLAVLLTFKGRFSPQERIAVNNKELIEFAGGEPYPTNKVQRHETRLRLVNAIAEQHKWGWEPDYSEWSDYLRPDLDADRADAIVRTGDGSEATPKPLPKGYWDDLLRATTYFTMPRRMLEANLKAAGQPAPSRALPGKRNRPARQPKPTPLTASDLKVLRLRLGLTQDEMGKQLGVSQAMVYFMEQGRRPISRAVQPKLKVLANRVPE